jgi:hypothetical protein
MASPSHFAAVADSFGTMRSLSQVSLVNLHLGQEARSAIAGKEQQLPAFIGFCFSLSSIVRAIAVPGALFHALLTLQANAATRELNARCRRPLQNRICILSHVCCLQRKKLLLTIPIKAYP